MVSSIHLIMFLCVLQIVPFEASEWRDKHKICIYVIPQFVCPDFLLLGSTPAFYFKKKNEHKICMTCSSRRIRKWRYHPNSSKIGLILMSTSSLRTRKMTHKLSQQVYHLVNGQRGGILKTYKTRM